MRYRPEIDGLRAIAVVPVILFHAGFELFSGGFVGVDVFFVISGYLITSIIINEMNEDRFSLVTFYERRARRILPALFFVMLVCLPFAWLWLIPRDLKDFAQSLIAVSTFSSNFLFWLESGYFAADAELKPLLHTWSLAVEEQYYILFPLFLMATWRLGKRSVLTILSVLFVASLAFGHWGAYNVPDAAFYLLWARGWEILIGALVAFYLNRKTEKDGENLTGSKGSLFKQSLSLLGLLMVGYAIFIFDQQTPFPSVYTLVPTVGVALIILFATNGTFANTLLSNRLFVGIGLISYSAYLWHQPLLSFAKHRSLSEPSDLMMFGLCIATFPLAYFSWRWIEKPFRNKHKVQRRSIFAFSIIGIGCFMLVGLVGHLAQGFPDGRLPQLAIQMAGYGSPKNPFGKTCNPGPGNYLPPSESCILGEKENIVGALIGDSHSEVFAFPMHQAMSEKGIGLRHMVYSGCPPITGLYRVDMRQDHRCAEYNSDVFEFISNDTSIQTLILVGRFTLYYHADRYDNGEGGIEHGQRAPVDLVERRGESVSDDVRKRDVLARYKSGIETLLGTGKKIVLVYPIPEQGWDVPLHAAKQVMFAGSADVTVSADSYFERNRIIYDLFDSLGAHENLERVYPAEVLCNSLVEGRCIGALDGQSYYHDDDHLSNYGASFITEQLMDSLLYD